MWTTVQMIDFMEATAGKTLINGRNIKTHMDEIYSFMVRPIICCAFEIHGVVYDCFFNSV